MANEIALVAANSIRIVESFEQFTAPGGEAFTAGQAGRLDTTSGKMTKSNGSSSTEARILGVATRTPEATGLGITFLKRGILDGYDLSGLAYDAKVYLSDTDGALSTAAGTVSIIVGRVVSGYAVGLNSPDKLLWLDLPANV